MTDTETYLPHERRAFGPFVLSTDERLLTRDGIVVEIGGRSFDILAVLTEQPGRVLSKRELIKRVWPDVVVEDGSLRFHMASLRRLLRDGEDGARYIATQVGVGYAFVAPIANQGRPEPHVAEDREVPPSAPSPLATARRSNFPPRLPRLIGRDRDLGLLAERITNIPFFTIVGPAGVGKTSLAIELGHSLAPSFDDQIVFVDFGMLENPALVPSMIAGALGISIHSDDPLAAILGHMRDRPLLLVLDNCEHVIEPAAQLIEELLQGAPQARILATSREPLRIRGEHVHRLDALSYPDHPAELGLEELLAYPAVQLFYDRALAADSNFAIDECDARLIADMCRRLDGMALPIELAAGRIATYGVGATARQLGERLIFHWSGRRNAQPRQRTLQAMLDWSFDLLSDVERCVLMRLAIFVGPFSIDAALAVVADGNLGTDEVARAVDELAAKSLLAADRTGRSGTFRLLEMTRAYAKHHLNADGDEEYSRTAQRHANFFLSELEAITGHDDDALLDAVTLRQQLGNVRSALEWSFGESGDRNRGIRLAAASARIFLTLSHLVECRNWTSRALAAVDDTMLGSGTEFELQGALGISLMFTRGNSEAAGAALARALEIATVLDDRKNQLRILGRLHIFHERIGEYEKAMEHAQKAIVVAETMDDAEALGVAYSLSGISHHLAGNQIRARADLEKSLAMTPVSVRRRTIHYGFDHRNRSGIALARTLWLTGFPAEAEQLARDTVAEAGKLDHPVTHCIALIWSLSISMWTANFVQAEKSLGAFAEQAAMNALGPYIAAASGLKGELAVRRGQPGEALTALEDSLARLRTSQYELLTTTFSIAIAQGLQLEGRYSEANEDLETAIARCNANGEHLALPEMLRLKAEIVHHDRGSVDRSIELLEEALALARHQGARAWELRAATDLTRLLAERGGTVEARRSLGKMLAKLPATHQSVDFDRATSLMEKLHANDDGEQRRRILPARISTN